MGFIEIFKYYKNIIIYTMKDEDDLSVHSCLLVTNNKQLEGGKI